MNAFASSIPVSSACEAWVEKSMGTRILRKPAMHPPAGLTPDEPVLTTKREQNPCQRASETPCALREGYTCRPWGARVPRDRTPAPSRLSDAPARISPEGSCEIRDGADHPLLALLVAAKIARGIAGTPVRMRPRTPSRSPPATRCSSARNRACSRSSASSSCARDGARPWSAGKKTLCSSSKCAARAAVNRSRAGGHRRDRRARVRRRLPWRSASSWWCCSAVCCASRFTRSRRPIWRADIPYGSPGLAARAAAPGCTVTQGKAVDCPTPREWRTRDAAAIFSEQATATGVRALPDPGALVILPHPTWPSEFWSSTTSRTCSSSCA